MAKKERKQQLTFEGRRYIEKVYKFMPKKDICEYLDIHLATLNRELARCEAGNYRAIDAEKDRAMKKKRKVSGLLDAQERRLHTYAVKKQIEAFLRLDSSISTKDLSDLLQEKQELIEFYLPEVKAKMKAEKEGVVSNEDSEQNETETRSNT